LIARDTFKAKTGSYEGISEQHVPDVLKQFPSHQDKNPHGRNKMTPIPIVHHWARGYDQNWNKRCALSITK
jgi:hypothetical protein